MSVLLLAFSHTVLANDSGTDKSSPIIFINPSEQFQVKRQPGFKYDPERAAIERDMALFSKQAGVPLDKVRASQAFQDAFYAYAEKVRARYPDKVSGVWVEPVPAKVGGIRFVGKVPVELSSEVQKRAQSNQVRLLGGGKTLEHNLEDYTFSVCEAVSNMDITNFTCEYNVPASRIDVEILTPDKSTVPYQSDILQSIYQRANSSQLMEKGSTLSPDDIHIEIKTSNDSVYVPTFHRGGMRAFRNNNPYVQCTTAWSITGFYGDGILTAGHCDNLRDGLGNYHVNHFPMYRVNHLFSLWTQDAGYYVNPGQLSAPKFYADVADVRTVRAVHPTNQMVGHLVCRFGRVSNFRSCDHTVVSTFAFSSVAANSPNNPFHVQFWLWPMVKVTNNTSVPGDSGGGWSKGNSAWGVQSGGTEDNRFGFFSAVHRIELSLGLTVKTLPY